MTLKDSSKVSLFLPQLRTRHGHITKVSNLVFKIYTYDMPHVYFRSLF